MLGPFVRWLGRLRAPEGRVGCCIQCGKRCTRLAVDDAGRPYMGCAHCEPMAAEAIRAMPNCPPRLFRDDDTNERTSKS